MAGFKIPLYSPLLNGNELKYLRDCVKAGWISSQGKFVVDFEKKFSRFCGAKYGIATCNGTAALHLALEALRIKEGDEVILPAFTFVATANAVSYTGAKPVFVDSEAATWGMDYKKIEDKITDRTKAIIVVHLYGIPGDLDRISKIAKKYNLYVIEDAAQAHGSKYKGKKTGGLADMSCFSFYANKTITTGDGGMMLTNNRKWRERACYLRDHCSSQRSYYYHSETGYNYKLTNIQAAVGVAQLEKIKSILLKKKNVFSRYSRLLKNVKGITLPPQAKWGEYAYWLYSILIEDNFGISRDRVISELRKSGIDTRPFFIPMHLLPMYKTGCKFPVAEELSRKGLSLPSSPGLKEEDILYVSGCIKKLSR